MWVSEYLHIDPNVTIISMYWVTQKLPQVYNSNHATLQIQIRKITVQICGNFWTTQYLGINSLTYMHVYIDE